MASIALFPSSFLTVKINFILDPICSYIQTLSSLSFLTLDFDFFNFRPSVASKESPESREANDCKTSLSIFEIPQRMSHQIKTITKHMLRFKRIYFPLGGMYSLGSVSKSCPLLFLNLRGGVCICSKNKLYLQLIGTMNRICSYPIKIFRYSRSTVFCFSSKKMQYFDYQATTPIDYRVLDAMMPYLTDMYGNPHSKTHKFGWDSSTAVDIARKQVADLIGADQKEIIFTSGATQSNNMVLKGLSKFYGDKKKHIITTQIQHKCILDTCRYLQLQGFRVTYLPVEKTGLIDVNLLRKTIEESKQAILCVSIIFVHNEIGVIQNMEEIGKLCREKGIFFHTDAAQAVGKVEVDVNKQKIDLMSISGHKIYGPKGIGALYLRRKPRVRLAPLINGGGQERGLRSGTLPTPLVVGIGKACEVAKREMKNDAEHIKKLYNKIINRIKEKMTHVELNGCSNQRYFGNVNMSFAFVEGESLLMAMKDYAISSGSACTSESLEPSYVLRALGVTEDLAHTSLRIGLGRFTSEEEVDEFLKDLERSVGRLRELSPLWQMVNEGIDIKTISWSQPH